MLALVFAGDRSTQSRGGEGSSLQQLYLVQMFFKGRPATIPGDYLAINVSYDRELVDINDEFGMPLGNVDITDRLHLTQFLDSVRGLDYKAIILDVNFDPALRSPYDSLLMVAVDSTPRLVVSVHSDGSSLINNEKTALADYEINLSDNNFTKYPYLIDGRESVALKAFRLGGGESGISADGLSAEQPAVYLMLPVTASEPYDENGDKTWYNLNTDILSVYDRASLASLVKDRTIVIGDYCDADIHNTYAGDISGPVIIINALETLRRGGNRVNLWSALLMAVVYLTLNLFFASGKSLWDVIPWELPKLLKVAAGMVSYTAVLLALAVMQFALFDEFHDAFLISLWLTGCYFVFNYLNEHYPMGGERPEK